MRNKLMYVIGLVFLTVGCTSLITDYREEGSRSYHRSFALIPNTKPFHKVIDVKNVEVHIVSDRKYYEHEPARDSKKGVVGYATIKNGVLQVWLLGKIVKGKIIIDHSTLGHEFNHILQYIDKEVVNPHKLRDMDL